MVSNRFLELLLSQCFQGLIIDPVHLTMNFTNWEDFKLYIYYKNFIQIIEDEFNGDEKIQNIVLRIKNEGWNTVILPKKNLTFTNIIQDANYLSKMNSAFIDGQELIWSTHNEKGITLKDLIEAFFRVKPLKFDYNYEILEKFELLVENEDSYSFELTFMY